VKINIMQASPWISLRYWRMA